MVKRLAQTALVEMTGEIIVIGNLLDLELMCLAAVDEAPHAMHLDRTSALVEQRRAPVMHPGETAVLGTDAIFAIEGLPAGPMRIEPLLTQQQIIGVKSPGQRASRGDDAGIGDAEHGRDRAVPSDGIGDEIPVIGHIAGSGQSDLQALRLTVDRGHVFRSLMLLWSNGQLKTRDRRILEPIVEANHFTKA